MLSDTELVEFYGIDEDDVQTLAFVRFLLEVESMENRSMFNSTDKLTDIAAHFKVIEGYLLDGTRSDELCELFDNTHYRFRNMRQIVEDNLVCHHDINEERKVTPANDASMRVNWYVPIPINKTDWCWFSACA